MRACAIIIALCGLIAFAVAANAAVYTFQPGDADLGDLDHNYYYTWGINWSIPTGQQVQAARLYINGLYNWAYESNDILYIHLLNTTTTGVTTGYDGQGSGDRYASQGGLLTTYTDLTDTVLENWSYSLTSDQVGLLASYAADGKFGLGFDPDCHYYNCGVKLEITTGPKYDMPVPSIPEPGTLILGSLGLSVVGFARRRRAA